MEIGRGFLGRSKKFQHKPRPPPFPRVRFAASLGPPLAPSRRVAPPTLRGRARRAASRQQASRQQASRQRGGRAARRWSVFATRTMSHSTCQTVTTLHDGAHVRTWRGLLRPAFGRGSWRSPTRLLGGAPAGAGKGISKLTRTLDGPSTGLARALASIGKGEGWTRIGITGFSDLGSRYRARAAEARARLMSRHDLRKLVLRHAEAFEELARAETSERSKS